MRVGVKYFVRKTFIKKRLTATATNNPWAGFADGIASSTASGTENVDSWSYTYFRWHAGNATGTNGRLYLDPDTYGRSPLERTSAWYPAGGRRENTYIGALGNLSNRGHYWYAVTSKDIAQDMWFHSELVGPIHTDPIFAMSVRCLSK